MSEAAYGDEIAARIGDVRTRALYDVLRQRLSKTVAVASPAAGADWSVAVPPNVVWEVLSVRGRFVTSVVAATRVVELQFADAAAVFCGVAPASTHAASLIGAYDYAIETTGSCQTTSRLAMSTGLPLLALQPGMTVGTATANIDVGDQWSLIVLRVREWSVGQVYWMSDLLGRELDYEVRTELSAIPSAPERTGQPIPVSPLAR